MDGLDFGFGLERKIIEAIDEQSRESDPDAPDRAQDRRDAYECGHRDAIEKCANLFDSEGSFQWLCMDHGGEEAEKIAKLIRAHGVAKEPK